MLKLRLKEVGLGSFVVALVLVSGTIAEDSPAKSLRETPTVRLIRQLQPTVLPVYVDVEPGRIGSGTATIIHPDGFLLSVDHVTAGKPGVVLLGRERVPYRIVGRLPEKDLAILKIQRSQPLPFTMLGRSHDLMAGEPIIAAGNPGGRGLVFTQGIISSPSIVVDSPSALAMTFFESGRDEFIQFDAASNRGNSGGLLANADGRQIGVINAKVYQEENINYAIPIDRIRHLLPNLLGVEEQGAFSTGLNVSMLADRAEVSEVWADSAASRCGLRPGDVIVECQGQTIRQGADWLLQLTQRKLEDSLALTWKRDGAEQRGALVLEKYPLPEPVAKEGKTPGLKYAAYQGQFAKMPDFAKLKPVREGETDRLQTNALSPVGPDRYALTYEGYLEFPKAGLFRLSLLSDDGSRMFLNNRMIIDNDFNHPAQELSRLVRVSAGLHPIRIEYFENTGDSELSLFIEGDKLPRQSAQGLFYRDQRD